MDIFLFHLLIGILMCLKSLGQIQGMLNARCYIDICQANFHLVKVISSDTRQTVARGVSSLERCLVSHNVVTFVRPSRPPRKDMSTLPTPPYSTHPNSCVFTPGCQVISRHPTIAPFLWSLKARKSRYFVLIIKDLWQQTGCKSIT